MSAWHAVQSAVSPVASLGEGGPELVSLPAGSRIMSTRRTAAARGGGLTVNNYIFGADLSTVEQRRRIVSDIAAGLHSHRAGGGF